MPAEDCEVDADGEAAVAACAAGAVKVVAKAMRTAVIHVNSAYAIRGMRAEDLT